MPDTCLCRVCAHPVPILAGDIDELKCPQCGYKIKCSPAQSALPTFVLSLTALILYIPANVFPFMTIELYGNRNSTTIWDGILSLADSGSWAIAGIVFLASLLIPLLKILALFYLSLSSEGSGDPKMKTKIYQITEALGRWSMLDIFLLAILVAIMKLGPWTQVEPEIGALMFALVVIFTMFASSQFDPQLIWKNKNENSSKN